MSTYREAILEKKISCKKASLRMNAWRVYGEESAVVFFDDWHCSTASLDKLIDYFALVDRLIVAVPKATTQDKVFQLCNLEVVDGVMLYEELEACLEKMPECKLGFEGLEPADPARWKKQTISL
jgi:hypothetical protein